MHSTIKRAVTVAVALGVAVLFGCTGMAGTTNDLSSELGGLLSRIKTKINHGQTAEADFADNLKEFDKLVAEHKGADPETLAEILALKVDVYLQVFQDAEKAAQVLKQIKRDYPESNIGKRVDSTLAALQPSIEKQRIRSKLVPGAAFPEFDTKDLNGKPLSLADYKGKVVLIDFWATWCPPCVAEVPNVVSVYNKYHDRGFDIIGISLDDHRGKLQSFIKDQGMSWPEYFDGLHWENKLAVKYGVDATPTNYLLDRKGRIIGKNLRGEALAQAVAKAMQD